jgi:hypothetical protein
VPIHKAKSKCQDSGSRLCWCEAIRMTIKTREKQISTTACDGGHSDVEVHSIPSPAPMLHYDNGGVEPGQTCRWRLKVEEDAHRQDIGWRHCGVGATELQSCLTEKVSREQA